jgi:hypothetical protein
MTVFFIAGERSFGSLNKTILAVVALTAILFVDQVVVGLCGNLSK